MPIALGETFSFDQTLPKRFPAGGVESEAYTKVAILGAGLAGLTCAFRLAEGGRRKLERSEVLVLEREPQVGGRIRSLQIGASVINLGALTLQPEHYPRYMILLADLGLTERVRFIPRRRMIFGYQGRVTRADNLSLVWDTAKSLVGRGVYSPAEALQLLRFYFFLRRVTAPASEAEFMALHEISVSEWARQFGFGENLKRKFLQPFIHYCFREPGEVSAAFGVFLLGFNLSHPATLVGGFGQVTDAMAARLGNVVETEAIALEATRELDEFAVVYAQRGRLRRLHSKFLVVAVPANVAAQIVPEMRTRAGVIDYGVGHGTVVAGRLRAKAEADLHLYTTVGPTGQVTYGGETLSLAAGLAALWEGFHGGRKCGEASTFQHSSISVFRPRSCYHFDRHPAFRHGFAIWTSASRSSIRQGVP